jgi:hypothetical protein
MMGGSGDLTAVSAELADRTRELAAQAAEAAQAGPGSHPGQVAGLLGTAAPGPDSGPAPGLAMVALAKETRVLAGSLLRLAVEHAHASGHTWPEIADVLGVSQQTAFQRFGRPAGPAPAAGEFASPVVTDAGDRAVAVLADWFEERYDAVAGTFGPAMAEKLPAAGLATARDQLTGTAGRYRRLGDGDPLVRQLGDYTVADVPLEFDVGLMKGRVAFDRSGRVAGLYVLPPATP